MSNKKSLLQDSLNELENIKNESLELAKEQLINESADLLEKKSAALFEKLISEEIGEISSDDESIEDEESEESGDELLNELKNIAGEFDDEESEDEEEEEDEEESEESDEEESEEESQISLDDLRKAAEEQGFKLVQAGSEEEEMDSDEEEDMDSEEEEMDSDEEEDIEFNDDEEFSDVDVDDKVLAEPSNDEEKLNENFKRNNTKMRNTKKQVLKDLRDVSFNKLVEAYYNMDDEDSFVVKEGEPEDEETMHSDYEDEKAFRRDRHQFEKPYIQGYDDDAFSDEEMDELEPMEDGYDYGMEDEGYHSVMDEEMYDMENEEIMYEIDTTEGGDYEPSLTDEELNQMLDEMDFQEGSMHSKSMNSSNKRFGMKHKGKFHDDEIMDLDEDMFDESIATDTRDKYVKQGLTGPIHGKAGVDEMESMFEEMTMEELEEMNQMLQDETGDSLPVQKAPKYMDEEMDLTEAEIEEMLAEMQHEDEIEESMSLKRSQANKHQAPSPRNREERIRPLAEEESEDASDVKSLKEKVAKLEKEKKDLNEGFVNKVKSLENKVYDVTISALKAGFVNKFLLENPLRENEKLEIIHRFSNAQTKEQIKETYISLTNEFAKGQTVKDGSMLNESVQNKVGRVHRTDNAIVTEKNLMNENDETNRFKQLLNYNFGRK